jgi:hypothetical protein
MSVRAGGFDQSVVAIIGIILPIGIVKMNGIMLPDLPSAGDELREQEGGSGGNAGPVRILHTAHRSAHRSNRNLDGRQAHRKSNGAVKYDRQ